MKEVCRYGGKRLCYLRRFFYRKKVVAVVGGGDTACEEAIYLAGLASKVYLVVRKPYLRASKIMQERVRKHDKIEVLLSIM